MRCLHAQRDNRRSLLRGFPKSTVKVIEGFLSAVGLIADGDYDQALALYIETYG